MKSKELEGFSPAPAKKTLAATPLFWDIVSSKTFQRLRSISFLGAIAYVIKPVSTTKRISRFDHSLSVAELALMIADKRGYDKDIKNHLVVAALLHDIGHGPLSHSMEDCFEKAYGISHHKVCEDIILGKSQHESHKALFKLISKHVDVNLVNSLISQQATDDFADIFNSPINIDTIDGIFKSCRYLYKTPAYDTHTLAQHLFVDTEHKDFSLMDAFWRCKHEVYNTLITTSIGALADQRAKECFTEKRLEASAFYLTENELFKQYDGFKAALMSSMLAGANGYHYSFDLLKRKYQIDTSKTDINKRFNCKKYRDTVNITVKTAKPHKSGDIIRGQQNDKESGQLVMNL